MLTFQLSFIMNNITKMLNLHTSLMMVQLYWSMQQYMFVFAETCSTEFIKYVVYQYLINCSMCCTQLFLC